MELLYWKEKLLNKKWRCAQSAQDIFADLESKYESQGPFKYSFRSSYMGIGKVHDVYNLESCHLGTSFFELL